MCAIVGLGRTTDTLISQVVRSAPCRSGSATPWLSHGKGAQVASQCILVIEDDMSVRTLLEKSLTARGYDVRLASDGLEGLTNLETLRPDLIIVDIMMPRLDGMTFVKAVKGNDQTKPIPVIFVTAKNDPKTMIEGINVGARFYITKPFQLEELLSKVQKALT